MDFTWLKGDLHCHCERHELVDELVEGAAGRLDFLAITNHAQKPVLQEQAGMVARARSLLPRTPVFFGLEWNGPAGRHINVIFPPSPHEAEDALAFAREHDCIRSGREPNVAAAMSALESLPPDARPIVFFNHPSALMAYRPEHLDQFHAAGPEVFVGIEAVHGHQAWAHVAAADPCAYPGSCIGGLCDHVYAAGRPFALLANSDLHIHKQRQRPDYPLGVFNLTHVGVGADAPRERAIFEALRRGRTCAAQGAWIELLRFSVGAAALGERCDCECAETLRLELTCAEPLRALDVIGQWSPDQPPDLRHAFGAQPEGKLCRELSIPAGARGFLRLRAIAARDDRPPPGPPAPRLFLSSAILLGPEAR